MGYLCINNYVARCASRATIPSMADLRINGITPRLRMQLKIAAAKAETTVRDFVIDALEKAVSK